MKTYIIPEVDIENYRVNILTAKLLCTEEIQMNIDIRGYQEYDLEEAKKIANIGDCLLIDYNSDDGHKLMPFQIVNKRIDENGELRCTLMSYYLLEKRAFDQKTNVWRDCELRHYLNDENGFLAKLDPEFVKLLKPVKIHTDNYVTEDRVWIPSHEEIGFVDKDKIFKPNVGTETFEYYKQEDTVAEVA